MILTEEKLKTNFPKAPADKIKSYGPVFGKACEAMGCRSVQAVLPVRSDNPIPQPLQDPAARQNAAAVPPGNARY